MKTTPGNIRVGTSGWSFPHWRKLYYPEEVRAKDQLAFISRRFPTLEANMTFHRFPTITILRHWKELVPEGFLFAVKANRTITHIKRLKRVKTTLRTYLRRVSAALNGACGPILFQFPSFFRPTPEHVERLDRFLADLREIAPAQRAAMEFRGPGWDAPEILRLLKRKRIAMVAAHSTRYPWYDADTADFRYVRLHGPGNLFESAYTDDELAAWAERFRAWSRKGNDVFAYFNNDVEGYAPNNAETLVRILAKSPD